MEPEKMIHAILPSLLKTYDPKKSGVTIDVGVGTHDFYCKIFKMHGYNTFAVEPLPSQKLKTLVQDLQINLIEACLLDKDGTVEIYTGQFNGMDCYDVSSIHHDWWGVNQRSVTHCVPSITLSTLIKTNDIRKITYLKIDTEGSEYNIIKQLNTIPQELLPEIIEFEYGGGAAKCDKKGGWAEKYLNNTLQSLELLKNLGYFYLLLFERENAQFEEHLLFDRPVEVIFQDHFVYGNILICREKKYNLKKLASYASRSFLQRFLNWR